MLNTAPEDFRNRTLGALPTLLERLAYICSLQGNDGSYHHWGFSRMFGNRSAQQAILAAHLDTAKELVRLPIREIFEEYQQALSRPQSAEILNPDSFILKAPVTGDGLLSSHLQLLRDSVAALALQERTTQRVA